MVEVWGQYGCESLAEEDCQVRETYSGRDACFLVVDEDGWTYRELEDDDVHN